MLGTNVMHQPSLIRVEHLYTEFGDNIIHQDVNLVIYKGEILSIVGGSGTGKTVLLRQLLQLDTPKKGHIYIFDVDMQRASSAQIAHFRTCSGVLFQRGALYSALTVFDNIAQPMRELHLPEKLIRELVYVKLNMVGIEPAHANKLPALLSGGMIKRVALARALALDPAILFLDEPTAGLDPHAADSFVDLIQSLHRELKFTVVMVTHDLDTLYGLSSRVAVLADKHIIIADALNMVLQHQHPFIQAFFLGARGKKIIE